MPVGCAKIVGLGTAVPERVLTNDELSQMVDTNDEWITQRTGIRERRIASEDQSASDLALKASHRALAEAGLQGSDIDAVICATITGDYPWPATACTIQHKLGASALAFDLSAGCTGWIYALVVADGLIRAGGVRNALVIGVEVLSKITDWTDRATCVLFGDGAGAAVVTAGSEDEGGIVAWDLGANGEDPSILWRQAGGSRFPLTPERLANGEHYIRTRGNEVYQFATRIVAQTCDRTLGKAGVTSDDVALLVPHQANERITESAARRFKMPRERVVSNIARYGNTSAASIPLALREAIDEGRLHRGDLALLVGFGAGLTWGSALVRWAM
jgi:3-oxoacyl-[acyl-carrier-protein] synthase III